MKTRPIYHIPKLSMCGGFLARNEVWWFWRTIHFMHYFSGGFGERTLHDHAVAAISWVGVNTLAFNLHK